MNDFDIKVLWVYIILLLAGGLIGFVKAGSKISLVSSAVFAALLILTTLRGVFQRGFALGLANVILVLLLLFAMRLGTTRKFMPSGLILLATVVVLALLNIKF
jgi:uncharacterized membrane protein (UPF0136 family)